MTEHVSMMTRRKTVIIFFVLLAFFLRMPAFIHSVTDIDESDFATQTMVWLKGGKPYIDFVEKKPPLIHAAYAAAFLIGGGWNMDAVHILFATMAAATALVLMAAANRVAGPKAGLVTLALYAIYQAGYDLNDFLSANTEVPMNLAAAAALYFGVRALGQDQRCLSLFLTGAMTGIAVLAKPVAISFLPALALADIASRLEQKNRWKIPSDVIAVAAGFALPLGLVALYLWRLDVLEDAIRWVWDANVSYAGSPQKFSTVAMHGAERFGLYLTVSLPLWFLAAGHFTTQVRKREFPPVYILLYTWLAMSFVTATLGGRFFPHYFLQFLPSLAMLAALGWTSWLGPAISGRRIVSVLLIAIGIAAPAIGFTILHLKEIANLPRKFGLEMEIAKKVSELTPPDAKIFVWGHNSDIYFYSRRLPATRFVYCSFLSGSSEGFESEARQGKPDPEARRLAMADLRRNQPELIVDMSGSSRRGYAKYPPSTFPELGYIIQKEYREAAIVHGARIYLRLK